MFDVERFREILKRCIGGESQVAFAKRCGISKEHLSRLLRSENPTTPAKKTLGKIAAVSEGVTTLDELLEVCGYFGSPAEARKRYRIEERAELTVEEMKKWFPEMTKGARVFSSPVEFLQECDMICITERLGNIFVSPKKEYEGDKHPGAEYVSWASVTIEDKSFSCRIFFALFYVETKGGNFVILDVGLDGASLLEAGGADADSIEKSGMTIKEFEAKTCVMSFKKKEDARSAEQRLLDAIFGGPRDEDHAYYMSIVGFGFHTEEITNENFKRFLEAHRETLCADKDSKTLFEEAVKSDSPKDIFKGEFEAFGGTCYGFEDLIASVMREETDFAFGAWDYRDESDFNRPCVMLPEDCAGYDPRILAPICEAYARELGLSEYGKCAILSKEYFTEDDTYTIDYEEGEQK